MRFTRLARAPLYMAAVVVASYMLIAGTHIAGSAEHPAGGSMMADGSMRMSAAMKSMLQAREQSNNCKSMMALKSSLKGAHCFKLRIDNIGRVDQYTASNGTRWTLPLSPGTFVVTSSGNPYFTLGRVDRGHGLKAQSEDGDPTMLATEVRAAYPESGAFLVPLGGTKPMGILPGHSFEFYLVASPSEKLYFTTMHGQSNDWYYGTTNGIALFHGNAMTHGDISSQVRLYDAGTEADEELGIGPSQGPRQPHPDYGKPDTNRDVRYAITDSRFLDAAKVMRMTVTPQ